MGGDARAAKYREASKFVTTFLLLKRKKRIQLTRRSLTRGSVPARHSAFPLVASSHYVFALRARHVFQVQSRILLKLRLLQGLRCLTEFNNNKTVVNRFVQRHKVVTLEALGPGSVLVSRERRESLREEECL